MYYNGNEKGVMQDYKERQSGIAWLLNKGFHRRNMVGYLYNNGEGVIQNYKEAVKWYKKAAEQGNTAGQFGLGTMYQKGHGVIQDIVSAHMWFNIASSNGHKIVAAIIEMFLIKGDSSDC